jgi:hypothetical protein
VSGSSCRFYTQLNPICNRCLEEEDPTVIRQDIEDETAATDAADKPPHTLAAVRIIASSRTLNRKVTLILKPQLMFAKLNRKPRIGSIWTN